MTFDAFARGKRENYGAGPGSYTIPSTFGQGPKYSFKGRPKDLKPQYSPQYNNLPSTLSKNAIYLGQRTPVGNRKIPKDTHYPGFKAIPSTIGEGPKMSIHNKYSKKQEVTPGPGQYETKALDKGLSYTVGEGKRFDFIHDDTSVGPGSYNIPSTIQVRTSHEPKKRVQPRRPKYVKVDNPGPIYDIEKPLGYDARKTSFGKVPQKARKQPDTPGPADYEISRDIVNRSRLAATMHIRPKGVTPDIITAPYYSIPSTIVPRKISMASRPATSYETPSPGPIYNIPTTIVPKKKSIGIKTETKIHDDDIPGPASYFRSDAPKDISQDVVCPLDMSYNRDLINYAEAKACPGPADYKPQVFDPEKEKGFTIKSKEEPDFRPDSAAPYRVLSSTLGGPAFTIGNKEYY